jgi:hypothetical protein
METDHAPENALLPRPRNVRYPEKTFRRKWAYPLCVDDFERSAIQHAVIDATDIGNDRIGLARLCVHVCLRCAQWRFDEHLKQGQMREDGTAPPCDDLEGPLADDRGYERPHQRSMVGKPPDTDTLT